MNKLGSEERLRLVLDEQATRAFPGGSAIWPQLRNRLAAASSRNTTRPRLVSVQVASAACLLLALLAIGVLTIPLGGGGGPTTVAVGGAKIPTATATAFVGAAQVLTQTIDGYTIELQPLFADKNQIIIEYKLTGPDGVPVGIMPTGAISPNSSTSWLALVDEQGNNYPALPIEFHDQQNSSAPEWLRQTGSATFRFDATKLGDNRLARLQLWMNLYQYVIHGTPDSFQLVPSEENTATVAGPFKFDFQMPVDQEMKIAEVHQTVEATGIELTLERVIVTATSAKAIVQVRHSDGSADQMVLDGTKLSLQGLGEFDWRGLHLANDYADSSENPDLLNLWAIHFNAPDWNKREFLRYEGPWTLTFSNVGRMEGNRLDGPWNFTFNAPIAAEAIPTTLPVLTPSAVGTPLRVITIQPGATATPTTQATTVRVTVTKGRTDAWVRVTIDGKVVVAQTLAGVTSREFSASESINVRTGRGDLVRVEINGVDKGYMGDPSNMIVEKEWNRDGNEIK